MGHLQPPADQTARLRAGASARIWVGSGRKPRATQAMTMERIRRRGCRLRQNRHGVPTPGHRVRRRRRIRHCRRRRWQLRIASALSRPCKYCCCCCGGVAIQSLVRTTSILDRAISEPGDCHRRRFCHRQLLVDNTMPNVDEVDGNVLFPDAIRPK